MTWLDAALFLSSAYPLARAWLANRTTSLVHALSWTVAAWLAWFGVHEAGPTVGPASYLALSLTGCAGIAVLGARRPIVTAWNFVLLGLLSVLLLPLAENAILRTPSFVDPLRVAFIIGTLAVGALNYLPTRLALSMLMLAIACALELHALLQDLQGPAATLFWSRWLVAGACWTGWLATKRRWKTLSESDQLWLAFRDRFGLMWAQRLREQFNRAAANAGWPVILRWRGLHKKTESPIPAETQSAIVNTLRDMLKRFGPV